MADSTGGKAVKLVGEGLLPGASLFLDGEIKSGTVHLLGGIVGATLIGPLGWVYAGADSFSKANTGKHFHEHFVGKASEAKS